MQRGVNESSKEILIAIQTCACLADWDYSNSESYATDRLDVLTRISSRLYTCTLCVHTYKYKIVGGQQYGSKNCCAKEKPAKHFSIQVWKLNLQITRNLFKILQTTTLNQSTFNLQIILTVYCINNRWLISVLHLSNSLEREWTINYILQHFQGGVG